MSVYHPAWVCLLMSCIGLASCGTTEEEAAALSEAVVADMEAAEINREFQESQDFDKIAQETVADMDTSGLEALSQ